MRSERPGFSKLRMNRAVARSSSSAVATLEVACQRALSSLGYSAGALDGSYGPATKQAVAGFQGARGLTADGIFGPKTLQALRRALGR